MKKILCFVLMTSLFSGFIPCEVKCIDENNEKYKIGAALGVASVLSSLACYACAKKAIKESSITLRCEDIADIKIAAKKLVDSFGKLTKGLEVLDQKTEELKQAIDALIIMQDVVDNHIMHDKKVPFKMILNIIRSTYKIINTLESEIKEGASDKTKLRDNLKVFLSEWLKHKKIISFIWDLLITGRVKTSTGWQATAFISWLIALGAGATSCMFMGSGNPENAKETVGTIAGVVIFLAALGSYPTGLVKGFSAN